MAAACNARPGFPFPPARLLALSARREVRRGDWCRQAGAAFLEAVRANRRLLATRGLHLSSAPLAMERLLQLLRDWLVKNIPADPTQSFLAAAICLGTRVGEPALCGLPPSLPQSPAL
jgi:hypothetical protein